MSDVKKRIATENGQSKIENALLKIAKAIEDINEDKPKEEAEIIRISTVNNTLYNPIQDSDLCTYSITFSKS